MFLALLGAAAALPTPEAGRTEASGSGGSTNPSKVIAYNYPAIGGYPFYYSSFPFNVYSSPITPYASPVTPYASPVTPYASPVTPYTSAITPYASPITPYSFPVVIPTQAVEDSTNSQSSRPKRSADAVPDADAEADPFFYTAFPFTPGTYQIPTPAATYKFPTAATYKFPVATTYKFPTATTYKFPTSTGFTFPAYQAPINPYQYTYTFPFPVVAKEESS